MRLCIIVKDEDGLEKELGRLSAIRLEAVQKKQLTQLLDRARAGGTPVSTEATRPGGPHGELRLSSAVDFGSMRMGYGEEYAPHVEYGHRTRNGGFVQGQKFLHKNVETQRPIYIEDLKKQIRKE